MIRKEATGRTFFGVRACFNGHFDAEGLKIRAMIVLHISFYRFVTVPDPEAWRGLLCTLAESLRLLGTVTIASEGINVSLASSDTAALADFMRAVRALPGLADVVCRETLGRAPGFNKLMVRVKRQILTFPEVDPPEAMSVAAINATASLSPAAFAAAVRELGPDGLVLDTRNNYEIDHGTFVGAEHLGIDEFCDFPAAFLSRYSTAKDRPILMYCTGGIRCEKAAAFAVAQGFTRVAKLEGGILAYIDAKTPELWQGECFVFDDRQAVTRADMVIDR